ncbi:hypothetical protein ABZX93_11985 [Streptomyces sp. NPDC006632]|uniref:hypothetical protein n=1 Tax=Streptomyces sp. NPDC006632 TaxID=3157182 RepID=UPI0033A9A503
MGLNVNYPVIGPEGKGTALTFQDPQVPLVPDFTDAGDGTWKVGVNAGPGGFAKAGVLLAGLRP